VKQAATDVTRLDRHHPHIKRSAHIRHVHSGSPPTGITGPANLFQIDDESL
jgi:hypothetical protein